MWALQLARTLKRQLVIPPLRFRISDKRYSDEDDFEYRPYSALFDPEPLARLHPIIDMQDFLDGVGGRVDLVFTVLRGMPPKGAAGTPPSLWVHANCTSLLLPEYARQQARMLA